MVPEKLGAPLPSHLGPGHPFRYQILNRLAETIPMSPHLPRNVSLEIDKVGFALVFPPPPPYWSRMPVLMPYFENSRRDGQNEPPFAYVS